MINRGQITLNRIADISTNYPLHFLVDGKLYLALAIATP
jgi:hypothetical protein